MNVLVSLVLTLLTTVLFVGDLISFLTCHDPLLKVGYGGLLLLLVFCYVVIWE